jgi:hypothetical protein
VETITDELKVLHAPPAHKRWEEIWKHELEVEESIRPRKRKKVVVKSKRKNKKRGKR